MQISNRQLWWMVLILEIGMTLLLSIRPTISEARQDAWMSFLVAGLFGMVAAYIAAQASLLYPKQTLIEFSMTILGKWPGKLVGLIFLLQWYWVTSAILRNVYNFISLSMLPRTPSYVILLGMIGVIVYALRKGGIVAIGRCSELWGPILLVILGLTFVLTMHNLDIHSLAPVYADSGLLAIAEGALTPASLLGEVVLIMMLFPFIDQPGPATRRNVLNGVLVSAVILLLGSMWVVMTFEPAVASAIYFPFFDMVKLVYLMEFIQHVDFLVVAVWLFSVFIKLSIYVFIASYGTAQWIGKQKNWRGIVWFVAAAVFTICMNLINLNPSPEMLLRKVWVQYVMPVNMVALPLLLWIVGSIRKR
ncbi:GerAB/ArcD/ProY family transporter [Paenibacillus medicaginis]|uniref:Endospore germination permease n=1 Tax=Paenibacillus medicaginis TaxID=1470560 RepID=A0ABV5BXP9_9BACL